MSQYKIIPTRRGWSLIDKQTGTTLHAGMTHDSAEKELAKYQKWEKERESEQP